MLVPAEPFGVVYDSDALMGLEEGPLLVHAVTYWRARNNHSSCWWAWSHYVALWFLESWISGGKRDFWLWYVFCFACILLDFKRYPCIHPALGIYAQLLLFIGFWHWVINIISQIWKTIFRYYTYRRCNIVFRLVCRTLTWRLTWASVPGSVATVRLRWRPWRWRRRERSSWSNWYLHIRSLIFALWG